MTSLAVCGYFLLGGAIVFTYPPLRSLVTAPLRESSSGRPAAIIVFIVVLALAITTWPIAWIRSAQATSRQSTTLSDIRSFLRQKGTNATESDSVLLSYHRVILQKFTEVAQSRGESLPSSISKEVALCYVWLWTEMNRNNLGIGLPVVLGGGLKIYRDQGIQALLKTLREENLPNSTLPA